MANDTPREPNVGDWLNTLMSSGLSFAGFYNDKNPWQHTDSFAKLTGDRAKWQAKQDKIKQWGKTTGFRNEAVSGSERAKQSARANAIAKAASPAPKKAAPAKPVPKPITPAPKAPATSNKYRAL